MTEPEELREQEEPEPLSLYTDLAAESYSIRSAEADIETRKAKLVEETRRLARSVKAGISTGDMTQDIMLSNQGESLWSRLELREEEQHIRSLLEYVKDRKGQPLLFGTINVSVVSPKLKLRFGFMESEDVEVNLENREVVFPTVATFMIFDSGSKELWRAGVEVDPVLESSSDPISVNLQDLVRTDTFFNPSPDNKDATILLAGEDAVNLIEEVDNVIGSLTLQYFRMAALSGIQLDVPDKIQAAYRRMCMEFSSEMLALAANPRSIFTELNSLKAKSLGFESIEAAVEYGHNFFQTSHRGAEKLRKHSR